MREHIGWARSNERKCKVCGNDMVLVRNLIGWEYICYNCHHFEGDGYG